MKKKVFTIAIIIIIALSSVIFTKIYADNPSSAVSIPNTSLKPGEQIKVYINVGNITNYTLSQIVLATDIYLEPAIDVATTGMTISDSTFDPLNKTFTIENIPAGVNTICVLYTIPDYIASGTKINVAYILLDEQGTQQEENNIQVTVMSDNSGNQNSTGDNGEGGTTGNQQQNIPNGQGNTNNNTNSSTNNNRNSNNSSMNRSTTGTGMLSYSGISNAQTVTYNGSRNNYLTNITVKGYSLTPKFNKTNNTYFITVANGVKSITITATKEDSSAVVTISGNTNLQVGLNKVLISVLAENGDVRYYRIYVTREG